MRLPSADLEHVLACAEPEFRALRGARMFITGGTGFFGTWLLESLAAANARLQLGIGATVLSRDPDAFRTRHPHLATVPGFDWCRGDVRDFRIPTDVFSHVVHAAATTD